MVRSCFILIVKMLIRYVAVGGPIRFMFEMRINPPLYYSFRHCSFHVELQDGTKWVFDPTGVQFGPEWPLLSSFDDYLRRRSLSNLYYQVQPLGHNAKRNRR